MTTAASDSLFALIKALSKSEKRQFRLYVGRLGINQDAKFITLFNLMDKMPAYDESQILKSGISTKSQLPNLKSHLYRQILVSLRLNPANRDIPLQIREQLDFATILYHKGLYRQSLKLLDKARNLALQNEEKNAAYEILEFEKLIETQYITRSMPDRAEELSRQAKELSRQNALASQLSDLSLQLYGQMLKVGYVRNDEDLARVKAYFDQALPSFDPDQLGFRERLWVYKAHLWYSFLTQDFLGCFRYSSKWVDLFEQYPEMVRRHPVFYLKGNHYLLESLFLVRYKSSFVSTLEKLERRLGEEGFPVTDNLQSLTFLYLSSNRLNRHFLQGTFEQGLQLVDRIEFGIRKHQGRIDIHHIMLLYYKIACMYFGSGDHRNCIAYLSRIIKSKDLKMREDLMCFARVLNLVAHYEAGMDYHLELQLRSTYKFLIKMNNLQAVQRAMIKFLRGLGDIYPGEINTAFRELHAELKSYEDHPYEKRAFLYLDIISWLESHLQKRPVGEVIREKAARITR